MLRKSGEQKWATWPDNNNWKGFREQFEEEYRRLWLLQNRPGGLEESLDWQFCR